MVGYSCLLFTVSQFPDVQRHFLPNLLYPEPYTNLTTNSQNFNAVIQIYTIEMLICNYSTVEMKIILVRPKISVKHKSIGIVSVAQILEIANASPNINHKSTKVAR